MKEKSTQTPEPEIFAPDEDIRASDESRVPKHLRTLAWLTDDMFKIPFTNIRTGLDAIIGLVPAVGDGLAGLLSLFVLFEAMRLGAPAKLGLRMLGNVLIDLVFGSIPLFGDIFDVSFRANKRNVKLLNVWLAEYDIDEDDLTTVV